MVQKGHWVHRALRATTRARTRVELAAKVMTSKGSLTSTRQISITARPPVYPLLHPSSPPSSAPFNRSGVLPCPFPIILRATIFSIGLATQVLSIICLLAGSRQIVHALSIDSLRLVHFMIDYCDCVYKLISRSTPR